MRRSMEASGVPADLLAEWTTAKGNGQRSFNMLKTYILCDGNLDAMRVALKNTSDHTKYKDHQFTWITRFELEQRYGTSEEARRFVKELCDSSFLGHVVLQWALACQNPTNLNVHSDVVHCRSDIRLPASKARRARRTHKCRNRTAPDYTACSRPRLRAQGSCILTHSSPQPAHAKLELRTS